jgi:outer membrane protein assembly factor BamD (BamD/ComL family)
MNTVKRRIRKIEDRARRKEIKIKKIYTFRTESIRKK